MSRLQASQGGKKRWHEQGEKAQARQIVREE